MFLCVVKKLNRKSNLHTLYLMLLIRHSFVRAFPFFFFNWPFGLGRLKVFYAQCKQWASLGGSAAKNPPSSAGDSGDASLIPGSGRTSGGGNGNPHQYFCLGNPMDRGAWRATVHEVTKSWTRFTDWECTHTCKQYTRFPHYWNTVIPQ